MFNPKDFAVLGGTGNHDLDKVILQAVNDQGPGGEQGSDYLSFSHLDIDTFPDSEPDVRVARYRELAGKHLILFQSIYNGPLQEQFLILVWAAANQYGARSITAVVPFMRYRRQDHPENPLEINRNLWLIENMRANGVDRLILCDIHSQTTLDNCRQVGIEAWNVDPSPAFVNHLRPLVQVAQEEGRSFFVYGPDRNAAAKAVVLAKQLDVGVAVTLKKRIRGDKVEIIKDPGALKALSQELNFDLVFADEKLAGTSICMRDDELATGGTAHATGWRLRDEIGVHEAFFCATHPVCTRGWKRTFIDGNPFVHIYFGNTVPRDYGKTTGGKITKVEMGQIIGNRLFLVMRGIK